MFTQGQSKVVHSGKESAFSVNTASESIQLDASSHVFGEQFNVERERLFYCGEKKLVPA